MRSLFRHPLALASISILLWATLASIGRGLAQVPPLLVTGLALGIGCLPAVRHARDWFSAPGILAFGAAGLFGYHFLLFASFQNAPPIEANLLNYLWPILIVLFSSVLLPDHRLKARHLIGAAMAFGGAALVITGGRPAFRAEHALGYVLALGAAVTWALYSVLSKRIGVFGTTAVGGFCAVSAALALTAHAALEPPATLSLVQWALLVALGLGPMGVAFYSWDASLKAGDPRVIGALSYFTPLLSTSLLAMTSAEASLSPVSGVALLLIVGGALISASGLWSGWNPLCKGMARSVQPMRGGADGQRRGRNQF